jgi:hypothetical protein
MTVTTSLVSETVRAANRLSSLRHEERKLLLQRGVATSAAPCGLLAKAGKISPMDESTERVVEDIARNIGENSRIQSGRGQLSRRCTLVSDTVAYALHHQAARPSVVSVDGRLPPRPPRLCCSAPNSNRPSAL